MATAVLPVSVPARKQPRPGQGGFEAHGLSEGEAWVRAIAEIVSSMVDLSRKTKTPSGPPRAASTVSHVRRSWLK
ncbi:hypothetical protein ACFX2I_038721 [Malus domestica]